MSKIYVLRSDDTVFILNKTDEDMTDEEVLEMFEGKAILNETQAREAFRNQIRISVQVGLQNLTSPDQRSSLMTMINSLPPEVRDLVGENFVKSQLDIIATGLPST